MEEDELELITDELELTEDELAWRVEPDEEVEKETLPPS